MRRPCSVRRTYLLGIVLLGTLFWPAPTRARPDAPSRAPSVTFGETIDVRVINVEVEVTDREGRRVTGLGADGFRLEVAGRERPIEYFTEVREGRAVASEDAPLPAVAGLERGQSVGVHYLVFIDDYLTFRGDRDRMLERLRGELPDLAPADRVAVVAFDGKRLDLLTGWTGSPRTRPAWRAARSSTPRWPTRPT